MDIGRSNLASDILQTMASSHPQVFDFLVHFLCKETEGNADSSTGDFFVSLDVIHYVPTLVVLVYSLWPPICWALFIHNFYCSRSLHTLISSLITTGWPKYLHEKYQETCFIPEHGVIISVSNVGLRVTHKSQLLKVDLKAFLPTSCERLVYF